MLKITTIGGGNGQSNLLDGISTFLGDKVQVSAIVSMSDDGRTTGSLMRAFDDELGLHLPPPGDLRRCLFSLSKSKYKEYFRLIFETTFLTEEKIENFTVLDLFQQIHKELLFFGKASDFKEEFENFAEEKGGLYTYIIEEFGAKKDFKLPLSCKLKDHKFGNILMGLLYYNLDKDYDKMLDFMHELLQVGGNIIPVTTKKAFIRAVLGNGEVIETQDRISNVAEYSSGIADLELMDSSLDATHHSKACEAIQNSDYILIGPGDLFTSTISNFIIGGIQNCIQKTNAKIIYIGNNTNKGGETMGLTALDFLNKIEHFVGRRIHMFIANNRKPELSEEEKKEFQNDISVKGGDYIFVSNGEKLELARRKIELIEADLLGESSYYKHSKRKLMKVLEDIFFGK
ncbi:YvcK family protein [Candidatus Gracilibacteria bacterium]|nr:YvcK family protein [Candidatus Gracilibacteria bacterium]